MSTATQIAIALRDLFLTLDDVDQASIDSYLPAAETRKAAVIIPPFRWQTQVHTFTAGRTPLMQSHRVPCEFWVKINKGKLAATHQRARELPLVAIRLLIANNTLGGTVQSVGFYGPGDRQLSIESEIDDRPVTVGNASYIVATIRVPVIDYADP